MNFVKQSIASAIHYFTNIMFVITADKILWFLLFSINNLFLILIITHNYKLSTYILCRLSINTSSMYLSVYLLDSYSILNISFFYRHTMFVKTLFFVSIIHNKLQFIVVHENTLIFDFSVCWCTSSYVKNCSCSQVSNTLK